MPDPFRRTDLHVYLVTFIHLQPFKEARASLERQLQRNEEELIKANDSRDNIMKTMRAKANKAEYEVKLATVRKQCLQEMQREMDEEMWRKNRDIQKQRSLEEVKCMEKTKPVSEMSETTKGSSSNSVSKPKVERRPVSKNVLILIFTGDPIERTLA